MLGSRVDWPMVVAARTVDLCLEREPRQLAERREGKPMKHSPTLDRRRRRSLQASAVMAVQAALALVACSHFLRMADLGHVGVLQLDWSEVVGRYQLSLPKEPPVGLRPTYNAAPGQMLPIIRPKDDGRELSLARWGLFADDTTITDAQAIHDSSTIRDTFIRRRCIIPATGWYEWKDSSAERERPYYLCPTAKPVAFAGIWDMGEDDGGATVLCFAIVTTEGVPRMQSIHHRMPVILEATKFQQWMLGMPNEAAALMAPYAGEIELWEQSPTAN
jgi:putative SOS response-associated peptidase YedK